MSAGRAGLFFQKYPSASLRLWGLPIGRCNAIKSNHLKNMKPYGLEMCFSKKNIPFVHLMLISDLSSYLLLYACLNLYSSSMFKLRTIVIMKVKI